jgi:hypothetical protein
MTIAVPRTPWPAAFPDVVVHGTLSARNHHPSYALAKAGDAQAALALVQAMLTEEGVNAIRALLQSRRPFIVPVVALEVSGFNAIPDAMAQELAARLGLTPLSGAVVQSNKVAHTKADGWHRLVTPAIFAGDIQADRDYWLVDDHVGFGGTLANLRGYIETHGGRVIGMTALTETGGGRKIAIRPETLSVLQGKHGQELNAFWQDLYGYGIDCLTELEAGYLSRVQSFDAIRNRMAEAAERARRQGLSPIGPSLPPPLSG